MLTGDQLWQALPLPAVLVDEDDVIIDVNPSAESFLMTSVKALIGAPFWRKIHIGRPIVDAFRRARHNNTTLFVNDVDVGKPGNPPTHSSLHIAPFSGQEGHMLILISPREIAGKITRGNSVKSAAKSAIGMAEMLSHEIKNPLAGIIGAAQLVSMNLKGDDLELTDLIVAESNRIVRLLDQVEQLGDLSPPNFQPINLHDVLDRARRSALVGFGAHMTIIKDYDPSLPLALGDLDQLVQVVLNLIKNASQAALPKTGTIRIRTFYEHSYRLKRGGGDTGVSLPLQVEIIDDGPGIAPEILNDIFDPFVSGHENGTGLGLALVNKIISQLNGWVSVNSVPGRTVFRLSFPVAPHHKDVF